MRNEDKLVPLRWVPKLVYGYDENNILVLKDDEKTNDQKNDLIKNYSGGVSISQIHRNIKPIKLKNYKVLNDEMGGDAPKDFIELYEYKKGKRTVSRNWDKYIAKVGHKWYPLESISEHLLNRIGEVLGLKMAESQLRLVHGQVRFFSKFFRKKNENIMHGAQIYSSYLEENVEFVEEIESQNWARALLTFQFTFEAVKFVFPYEHDSIMNHLVELLVFDAITGNNDRHFYNWAVLNHIEGKNPPKFSPIYDSARGLFWNDREDKLINRFFITKKRKQEINYNNLEKYIYLSRPKIGWEGWSSDKEINHFQLIANINEHYPKFQPICKSLIKSVHLSNIHKMVDNEFTTFYSPNRLFLIKECLKRRFEILNNLCNSDCYD